jgi:hypothetical protein
MESCILSFFLIIFNRFLAFLWTKWVKFKSSLCARLLKFALQAPWICITVHRALSMMTSSAFVICEGRTTKQLYYFWRFFFQKIDMILFIIVSWLFVIWFKTSLMCRVEVQIQSHSKWTQLYFKRKTSSTSQVNSFLSSLAHEGVHPSPSTMSKHTYIWGTYTCALYL